MTDPVQQLHANLAHTHDLTSPGIWAKRPDTGDLACVRGCTRWGRHLPTCVNHDLHDDQCPGPPCDGCAADQCHGCEPRLRDRGLLCVKCIDTLSRLLGPVELFDDRAPSVATTCAWLASNLGQLRSKSAGSTRGGGNGDGLVAVMVALSDLQIVLVEVATWFLRDHQMQPLTDTDPGTVAARLRPWIGSLAAWDPISDILDDLLEFRGTAAQVCPWRGIERDPDQAAVLLHLAPAETTEEVCVRFSLKPARLWKWHERGRLHPLNPEERPHRWMPWDVYELLHPDTAREFKARLASTAR